MTMRWKFSCTSDIENVHCGECRYVSVMSFTRPQIFAKINTNKFRTFCVYGAMHDARYREVKTVLASDPSKRNN